MPIEVKCSNCGKGLKAPDSMAGKKAKCPGCGSIVVVSQPMEEILDAEIIEPTPAPLTSNLGSLLDDELAYRVAEPDPVPADQGRLEERRPCPACGEMIVSSAAKCRFCGEIFDSNLRKKSQDVSSEAIKKFRREMHGLGGFWIFIGALATFAAIMLAAVEPPAGVDPSDLQAIGSAVFFVLGSAWVVLGIFTCLKKMWAVYVGLGISYLSLLGNLVNLNICGLVIVIVVIIQAHRCISAASKFRAAGIDLTRTR